MEISEATLDDVPAAARMLSLTEPDRVMTPAGMLHFVSTVPARARRRLWKAEVDGVLVAWAAAGLNWESDTEGGAYAGLTVHPDQRSRGIGTALWTLIEERLDEIGAERVSVMGADEPRSHAFAAARGFSETYRLRFSRLDLGQLPPQPPVPADVELRPFTAFADDPRPIWAIDSEASRDIPLDQPIGEVLYEDWLARYWQMPMVDFEASLVALVDGEPASFTIVGVDPATRRLESGMTGTLRRFRGRGLAELVKRHSLARARASGIELAFTENDETNRAMLTVNERIGYRPTSARVTFSRP
jgi:GNAT superfamily N-acetyltransferase